MMKRKTLFIFSFLVLLLVTTACSQKDNKQDDNIQAENQNSTSTESRENWQDNFDTLSTTDLQVAKIVSVTAKQDTSGNLLAQTIMLAASFDELLKFQPGPGNFERPSSTMPSQNVGVDNGRARQRPDFNNLTDEQKAQFEEMRQQGGAENGSSGQKRNFAAGMENLQGEILSFIDGQLILKLKDGGSKMVFLSADTKIFAAPTSTPE